MARSKSVLVLSLLAAAIVPTCIVAQELPRQIPRVVPILEQSNLGETRFQLTRNQLEGVGIPEASYPGGDRDVAALSELALQLTGSETRVDGLLRTALGEIGFQSTVQSDGTVRVEYELPHAQGSLTLNVDRSNQTAQAEYPAGFMMTASDRFLFRSLAVALARNKEDGTAFDTLLRTSNLWGAHPIARVRLTRITAPREKSWTNLCGVTAAWLYHDATTHALLSEYLPTGPSSPSCRARCGAGCNAIIGTSAWTVDCGGHDRCVETHGDNTGPNCGNEFTAASDDYLFASNCNLTGW
ncbi:MAG TPA: hypothetical protein VLB76_26615 [Thermoanaerobaculia bacterium]|jgi:hypothetical protein|nr:hypothetical protein [Thermoanaerobaculia bacterium]